MVKKIIKFFIPFVLLNFLKKKREKILMNKFKKLDLGMVFEKIYKEKLWTSKTDKNNFKFYSGPGSHNEKFTNEYILKVNNFLKSFENKPSVVDLGCGDFEVSSKIFQNSSNFIGCDIFPDLIEQNKKKYINDNLNFKVLDITRDQIPAADICIIRCVLQHLSNKMIQQIINNIKNKFKFLIVTEHFPNNDEFIPNIDIISGPNIRLSKNSAVDLTKPPFDLKTVQNISICKLYSDNFEGFLNTIIYKL